MGHLIKIFQSKGFNSNTSGSERDGKTCLRVLFAIAVLSLVGCINGRVTQNPNTAQPTPTPTQEQIIFPDFLNPTDQFFPPDASELKIVFEPKVFTHPENIFSIDISKNWQVDADQYGAAITDPQNNLVMTVTVVNTGNVLDLESFENFIRIQEEKISTDFSEYILIDNHEIAKETSYLMTKLVSIEGHQKILTTNYQQHKAYILKIEFLADKDFYKANLDTYFEIINSASINPDIAPDLEIYSFDIANRFSNGYFSILVPPFWHNTEVKDEFSILNTFSSPDGQAIIQTLVFDDGNRMSNTIAAGFALKLLRDNYAKNIIIFKDEMMPDGRENLQWRTENDNYHGETAFATCGSALFMMTVMAEEDLDPIYQTLLEDVIASYSVDVVCE